MIDDDPEKPSTHNALRELLAHNTESSQTPESVVVTQPIKPAAVLRRIEDACQHAERAHVLTPNRHIAATVAGLTQSPIHNITARGAKPYRTQRCARTTAGTLLVQDIELPRVEVEFIARDAIELTAGDTVLHRCPFGCTLADTLTELPDELFLAQYDEEAAAWTITRDDGTLVETFATAHECNQSYPRIPGWFQPDQLSYRSDVIIHYPDPGSPGDLVAYEEPTPRVHASIQASLKEFLRQFTTEDADHNLEAREVFNRYRAWLDADEPSDLTEATFDYALSRLPEFEMTEPVRGSGNPVICDRIWRFPPTQTPE